MTDSGWRTAIFALLAVAGIVGCGQRSAEQTSVDSNEAASADASGSAFCLMLRSARERVLVGEPLTLIATLENCSNDSVAVRDLLDPEYRILSLLVRRPTGGDGDYLELAVARDGRGWGEVTLAPGEMLTAFVPAYFGKSGWQLADEGQYHFQAEFWIDDLQVDSNAVQVEVSYPGDVPAADAAEAFMMPQVAQAYYMNGGTGSTGLDEIVTAWPDSPHAKYARLALAIEVAANAEQPRVQACRRLEEATFDLNFDWIVALRALQSLSSCYRRAGMHPESMRVVGDFTERFPEAAKIIDNRVN